MMTYEKARVYLEHISKYGSVLGLDSIRRLLDQLGNPQNKLKFMHIAGTNGKGSILINVSCILEKAGYRVGRYLSPTVLGYLERFQVNGEWMAEEDLAFYVSVVKQAIDELKEQGFPEPTVFEVETAIAFLYFEKEACDYVVLETGMGGLTDATNIIPPPLVCAFASVSMDHIGVLGDTLEEIAEIKAGIIKCGTIVVPGIQKPEVRHIIERKAEQQQAVVQAVCAKEWIVEKRELTGQTFSYGEFRHVEISLLGEYQVENAVTALEVIRALRSTGADISDIAVREGFQCVTWPGRFQILGKEPLIIADGAHNTDAVARLLENISDYLQGKRLIAVTGVFADKEYQTMAELMAPKLCEVFTIDLPNRERTLSREKLAEVYSALGVKATVSQTIEDAVASAKQAAKETENGMVLLFGSLSYLGTAIRTAMVAECGKAEER